jgi:hypothetical protein
MPALGVFYFFYILRSWKTVVTPVSAHPHTQENPHTDGRKPGPAPNLPGCWEPSAFPEAQNSLGCPRLPLPGVVFPLFWLGLGITIGPETGCKWGFFLGEDQCGLLGLEAQEWAVCGSGCTASAQLDFRPTAHLSHRKQSQAWLGWALERS